MEGSKKREQTQTIVDHRSRARAMLLLRAVARLLTIRVNLREHITCGHLLSLDKRRQEGRSGRHREGFARRRSSARCRSRLHRGSRRSHAHVAGHICAACSANARAAFAVGSVNVTEHRDDGIAERSKGAEDGDWSSGCDQLGASREKSEWERGGERERTPRVVGTATRASSEARKREHGPRVANLCAASSRPRVALARASSSLLYARLSRACCSLLLCARSCADRSSLERWHCSVLRCSRCALAWLGGSLGGAGRSASEANDAQKSCEEEQRRDARAGRSEAAVRAKYASHRIAVERLRMSG